MDRQSSCTKCQRPDTADNLVGCDTCTTWMHYGCAGVTDSIADVDRSWKCDQCLQDGSVHRSRASTGRSSSSKRSSRIELSLRLMEEQKALRMRRILEEEAAQAATRRKIAEEEETFLRNKYDLLLAEAESSEDGTSRRSRLSSRASREKVESWLGDQEVGTALQAKVVPSSSIAATVVSSATVHQSPDSAPIVAHPAASNVPVVVARGPGSTSTPTSVDGSRSVGCSVAASGIPPVPILVPARADFVSHTEITFEVPQKPPVSPSLSTKAPIATSSIAPIDARSVPLKTGISAPPPIVNFLPPSSCNRPPERKVSQFPTKVSRTFGFGSEEGTRSASGGPMTHSSLVGKSLPVVSSVNYGNSSRANRNPTLLTTPSVPSQQHTSNSLLHNYHHNIAPQYVAHHPAMSFSDGGQGCPGEGYAVSSHHPVSSVPMRLPRSTISANCQPTWMNNSISSTGLGGIQPIQEEEEGFAVSVSDSMRVNHSVPPASRAAVPLFGIPAAVSSAFSIPPIGQQPPPQQQYHQQQVPVQQQQAAALGRNGPSNEQLAARQVMPRELPNFGGNPQDWPLFYSSFCNSTEACGFTDSENLARLQRCLKGNALEAVKSRLLMPQSVPFVIDTLRRLFGRPEILIHSLLQKLRSVPAPKMDNLQSQITFGLAVQNVVDHKSIANLADHLWNPTLLYELVEKLPSQLKMQWSYYKSRYANVNLATFSAFMSEIVVMASDVTLPVDALSSSSKPEKSSKEKPKLYLHAGEQQKPADVGEKPSASTEPPKKTCVYCGNEQHEIANCKQFKALDIDGRWKAVKQKNLCRSCLVPHRKWPCRTKKECGINGCRIFHHNLLHSPNSSEKAGTSTATANTSTVVHQNLHRSTSFSLFRYLPVTIHGNGKQINTYAFLDDGSNSTLLECSIAKALDIKGPTDGFCLSWTGNISREEKESQRVSVVICGDGKKFKLNNVRTVQQLQLPAQTMCYEDLARTYRHLNGLPVQSYTNATPGIIIGIEHIRLLTALRTREGSDNEPVATKTRLGWCIFGKNSDGGNVMEQLNLHQAGDIENRELHQWMKQFFAVEESSVTVKPEAEEDKRARKIMEATIRRVDDGFEMGLLWKYDDVCFPDSYPMALRRLQSLEKRLSKDPVLEARVREQVMQYEAKGYAHRITPEELESTDSSKVWYLPLGVVQNPKKPDKLRLIWDAKARAGGMSFNDSLLKGPDLLVVLTEVLLRFRQGNIAMVGDIKEMFHQIWIRLADRQAQRFLYRPHPEKDPQIYVMDVATFGATCSPSLAQFVKNKNAEEFAETFPRAAKAVTKNHYVDDYLDSVDTEDEAIQLINEVKHIHSQGGFEIRNFCSNSPEVLASIGESAAQQKVSMNLENTSELERVLGLIWKPTEDVFTFDVSSMKEEIKTLIQSGTTPSKRQVLRTVMSLFDPLGFIAHFVVHGKILMQQIWRSGTDWDEPIPEELQEKWIQWCQCMQRLDEVKVPRCYFKGVRIAALKNAEAHLFVDASEQACAAVLYLRYVDNGNPRCALVAAKTKVAPLKPLSIPRLELQAAMIGTRLLDSTLNSLDFQVSKRFLWTDSSTVLSWLRSDSRRYHQFVAFRVGEILTTTSVDEWRHVPTKLNIADAATKWKDGPSFDPNDPWYSAPEFLYQTEDQWPTEALEKRTTTETELRSVFLFHGTIPQVAVDFSRFSNWDRLLRTTAYVLRAVRRFRGEKPTKPDLLSQEELADAETAIWKQIQAEAYPDEYAILQRNLANPSSHVSIPKSSPLYGLSAFADERGVIRMNSRISTAPTVAYDMKYPIVLPRKHPGVHLLAERYHRRFLHANGETVGNEMRQRFCIPGLRVLIRQLSKQCMTCRVRKAEPAPPMMSAHRTFRVTGMVRPFTHTGVDYLGPVLVKQGRSLVKRWVALFTCLTVRAVHLEVVHSLSTQSCVMAIRRFIARRGSPEAFYSDNGTNFLGASNLLRSQIQDINEDCAVTFTNSKTSWHFNPPSAPHMGGSWERMVRSVKVAMEAMADHPHHPSDEVLETVVLEAESIVNSRPLTYIPLESAEQESLTPNHFLLFGTKGVTQPEMSTEVKGSILRDSWRLAQCLVNHFWSRWVREYLPTITRRTKWFEPVKPLKAGDLVLVVESGKRNGWLRGRVVDVIKAMDGQVRRALVMTKNGLMNRPAVKLALLDLQIPGDGPELHGQGDVTDASRTLLTGR